MRQSIVVTLCFVIGSVSLSAFAENYEQGNSGRIEHDGTTPHSTAGDRGQRAALPPLLWEHFFGQSGNAIAVADLNGDEYMDVVTVSSVQNEATAIDGQTGLELWTWVSTGNLYCVVTGDSDNNGEIDVAVAGADNQVTLLQGSTGAILWQFPLPNQVYRKNLAAVDVDGNGNVDIVVGCDNSVVYCLNGANGTVIWDRYIFSDPGEIEIADMDNNSVPDVIVSNRGATFGVYVLNGADGSDLWLPYSFAAAPRYLEIFDANGDLIPDIAVGMVGGNSIYVIDGSSGLWLWVSTPYSIPIGVHGFAGGDVNNDGNEDLIVPGDATDRHVYAVNGADGTFLWSFPTGGEINCLLVEEMTGDEYPDVIVGSDDDTVYVLNGLDGSLYFSYGTAGDVMHAAVGDISGSGAPSVAVTTFAYPGMAYAFEAFYTPVISCCVGTSVGNMDAIAGVPDMGDLTLLIDMLFISLNELPCLQEADVDFSNQPDPVATDITMGDLTVLIDNLFISLNPLPACP